MNKHNKTLALYIILRLIVIFVLVCQLVVKNYQSMFLCLLTLLLFFIPGIVEKSFNIYVSDILETAILLFIFSAQILGEVASFYTRFSFWDCLLHALHGFLAAAVGFSTVDFCNRNERFSLSMSPLYMAIASFCFSMTIGVIWEFYEFTMDLLCNTDMQKDAIISEISSVLLSSEKNNTVTVKIESLVVNGKNWFDYCGGYIDIGLIDTMIDLFINALGALVFSVLGVASNKKLFRKIADAFIPKIK